MPTSVILLPGVANKMQPHCLFKGDRPSLPPPPDTHTMHSTLPMPSGSKLLKYTEEGGGSGEMAQLTWFGMVAPCPRQKNGNREPRLEKSSHSGMGQAALASGSFGMQTGQACFFSPPLLPSQPTHPLPPPFAWDSVTAAAFATAVLLARSSSSHSRGRRLRTERNAGTMNCSAATAAPPFARWAITSSFQLGEKGREDRARPLALSESPRCSLGTVVPSFLNSHHSPRTPRGLRTTPPVRPCAAQPQKRPLPQRRARGEGLSPAGAEAALSQGGHVGSGVDDGGFRGQGWGTRRWSSEPG